MHEIEKAGWLHLFYLTQCVNKHDKVISEENVKTARPLSSLTVGADHAQMQKIFPFKCLNATILYLT